MKQEMRVGSLVEHKQYGMGVVKEITSPNILVNYAKYLVHFDKAHNKYAAGGKVVDNHRLWCVSHELELKITYVDELTCGTTLNMPANFLKEKAMTTNQQYHMRFSISELTLAVRFIEYMEKHNLHNSPLIYDDVSFYTIHFTKDALTKLVTYLGAESDAAFANTILVRLCNSNLVWGA